MVEFRDVVKKYTDPGEALGRDPDTGDVTGLVPGTDVDPVEVVTDPAAQAALSATFAPLAAGIEGTGMPEGVVTAPVGTVYRDLAATSGAVLWVKATGTGNTGWRVAWGDTGWRRLTEWDASGAYLPGMPPLLAPFTPRTTHPQGGWIRIRRVGSRVMLTARNIDAASGGGTDEPLLAAPLELGGWPGFAPVASTSLVLATSQTVNALYGFRAYGGNLRLITPAPVTAGNIVSSVGILAEFETHDAWPSVLPGVAV